MKLIRFFLFSLLITFCLSLPAQVNCYEITRNKGIESYNKGDFQEAAKYFEAAKFCDDRPGNNDLDSWLDKCVVNVRLSSKSLEFEAVGGEEQIVEVTTKSKTIKVSTPPKWCSVDKKDKTLTVYCEDNETVFAREAKITITAAGKKAVLEIFQEGMALELDFEPKMVDFSSQVDTVMVGVESNVADWVVDSVPSWVTAERIADSLRIICQKNASSKTRQGDVSILAFERLFHLPVRQVPGDTVLSLSKTEMIFSDLYSNDGFSVRCNMAQWEVSASENWIGVSKKNDSIKVFASENTSVFSRHGVVQVSCGNHHREVQIHQKPFVSKLVKPESELKGFTSSENDFVSVTSVPSGLVFYIDDTIAKVTPYNFYRDYEHHSLLVGFERNEFIFNEKQQDIVFEPGLRFATITFTAPKNIGLRTGFISANQFGAYSHFQASRPLVKEFAADSIKVDGYHFMVGPVYSPIQYAAIYAGVGVGIHEGPTTNGVPNINVDYEAGLMGLFKNATVSLGFRTTKWGFGDATKRTTFVFGIGGYLKRYYDPNRGYCTSDSRRWLSLNYMTRPAVNGKGAMIGDIGKGKIRSYFKGMYAQPYEAVRNVDASLGLIFTPVNGLIDFCIGAGGGLAFVDSQIENYSVDAEAGFIVNLWRIPLTVMLHESNVIGEPKLYVDFGVGFHLGEFSRSSYK